MIHVQPAAEPSPAHKDVWDKLGILLPFLSGLLVSGVGLYFTVSYNQQANRLAELQTMERYIAQLTGPDDAKRLARQVIARFATPEMQKALSELSSEGPAAQRAVARAAQIAAASLIFDNTNIGGVGNEGISPVIALSRPHLIASIGTYHWNNGRGSNPGTLALKREDGMVFGPWPAVATSGFQGAPNVNWESAPNVTIPTGRYTVIDSDPATWSQNEMSSGMGFVRIKATPTDTVE